MYVMKEQISKLEENWNNLLDISYILLNKNRRLQDEVDVSRTDYRDNTLIHSGPALSGLQLDKLYRDLGDAITITNLSITKRKEYQIYIDTLLDKISAARKNARFRPSKTKKHNHKPKDEDEDKDEDNPYFIGGKRRTGKRRTRKRKMR